MNKIRILLAIDHKENRRLLQTYLEERYAVILADSEDSLKENFDLGIFDGMMLNRLWTQIRTRKENEKSLFLPFLLVTTRPDVRMMTRQLGQGIDELIFTPIEKIELLARVEVLLRTRRLSLELAGRNTELQREIIAHQETENALRASEQQTKLLQKLTAELAAVMTSDDLSSLIADHVSAALHGHLGIIAILSRNGRDIEILSPYQRISLDAPVPVAHVIRTGQPLWLETLEDHLTQFPDFQASFNGVSTQATAVTPVMIDGQTIGAVSISFPQPQHFSEDDQNFFRILAQQCAQALERARSYEDEHERATSEERRRLARDLHDSVSQNLFAISVISQILPRLWDRNPEQAKEKTEELTALTQGATLEMQTLLTQLHPAKIVGRSLKDLFGQLSETVRARQEINISCTVEFEQALPENVHITLYRIVQESLNNIVKHSEASEVHISLICENQQLILRIRDNGRGFDPQTRAVGMGLKSMGERAALIGASYDVFSERGQGTEIILSWALPS